MKLNRTPNLFDGRDVSDSPASRFGNVKVHKFVSKTSAVPASDYERTQKTEASDAGKRAKKIVDRLNKSDT